MSLNKISLSDIEEYLKLQRLELTFRLRLIEFKNLTKERLELVKELKQDVETLNAFKQKFRNQIPKDKEIDIEIKKILNKTFKGLEI